MKITPIKTNKITHPAPDIFTLLDTYFKMIEEKTIVAITSKVLSICQGRIIKNDGQINKKKLIQKEADYYLENEPLPGIVLTIKNNLLIPSAGIDESNANGYFILWPKNIQESTNEIREHLVKKHKKKHIGVIITDSHTTMLRRGTTGIGLNHSGFQALKNYIGEKDLFGRTIEVTSSNHLDGLAAAAVVAMGEGSEQTPLALITKVPFVTFQDKNPTKEELSLLHIPPHEDIYEPIIDIAKWESGKK